MENNNGYFVNVVIGFEDDSTNNANMISCREFYRQIHVSGRPQGHSANKIIVNKYDEIFAVKCSCALVHPVVKNGEYSVLWDAKMDPKLMVRFKNMSHNDVLNCINL